MPAPLFPVVSKTVEVCPYALWTKDHCQTKGQEADTHNECCESVAWCRCMYGKECNDYFAPIGVANLWRPVESLGESVRWVFGVVMNRVMVNRAVPHLIGHPGVIRIEVTGCSPNGVPPSLNGVLH